MGEIYTKNERWQEYVTRTMENDKIPFATFESLGDRLGQTNKRLFILSIILMILLLFTNLGWLYYESQYKVEETTMIESEQDGDVNIVGGGNVNYGSESTDNQDKKTSP